MKKASLIIVPILIWAIGIPASAQRNADIENIGTRDINSGGLPGAADVTVLSFEEEIELGRSLAADLEANVVVSDDVVITRYVGGVGQRLVAHSDARVPFTFKVIEDASINGLALPGGFVYVNTGLLGASRNEAELASALAHLIATVAARHAVENQARATLLNVLSVPLIFVGGAPAAPLAQAASFAVPASIYSFSRSRVDEADFLGLQYLYTAGYDPEAAASFLETVQAGEADDARESPVLASHPATADRIETTRRNIGELLPPRAGNIVTTPEFAEMQARLAARETNPQPVSRRNQQP